MKEKKMDTTTIHELHLIGGALIVAGFLLSLFGGLCWVAAKGWFG